MPVDCALITALPKELNNLRFHFRSSKTIIDESNIYFETMSPNGLALVGAICDGAGQLNAAALTMDVITKYQPKTIILVGIAGGLDRNIGLGDVVVSSQIADYELGKVTPSGIDIRWSVYPVDATLLSKAQNYRNSSWTEYIRTPRPDGEKSKSKPSHHVGLYLSGNKVIADEGASGALRSFWRHSAAIEMEAAGIAAMLRRMPSPPSFIVIKSICDYADAEKNDDWQMYAADAAASFAYSFVIDSLKPQDFVWPHRAAEPNVVIGEIDFQGLLVAVRGTYDLSELGALYSDLGIKWDESTSSTESEMITALLDYCRRNKSLHFSAPAQMEWESKRQLLPDTSQDNVELLTLGSYLSNSSADEVLL